MTKTIGVALGGGGVRGLAHIPVLKALDELEIKPSFIAGTSMGAIIGALYCSGMSADDIEQRIRQHIVLKNDNLKSVIKKSKHLSTWLKVFSPDFSFSGLVTADGVFKHLFNELQDKTFADLEIEFTAIACDYWSGEEVIQTKGELLSAVEASMAVPGVFSPMERNDRFLIDGGVVNNLPYELVQEKCDICIAVDVTNLPAKDKKGMPNALEVATGALDIMQLDALKRRLEISLPDILVRPEMESVDLFDFHKIEYVLGTGQEAANKMREQIKTLLI